MQRVSEFTRRFAYLLEDVELEEKAPGSRWTLHGLLRQMQRHYGEHTANTIKNFDLPGWPINWSAILKTGYQPLGMISVCFEIHRDESVTMRIRFLKFGGNVDVLIELHLFQTALERVRSDMSVIKSILFSITILLWGGRVIADDPSADQILKQVEVAYESLQSYKATGTIAVDMDTGATKLKQETRFSILLKRPNMYRITWNQTGMTKQSGAVWNDGNRPFLYMSAMNAYSQMASDEIALGGATGISGGAAHTIPSLFLPTFKAQTAPFSRLKNVQIEKSETLDGEDCYVISGSSTVSKKETFWVSKSSHLIRQYSRSLEPPKGGALIPEMTDKQIEESIKALGQKVTEKRKAEMKQMMERMRTQMKTMNLKGLSMETHSNIASPNLADADFQYSPPEGAVLTENMLGGAFGGKRQQRFKTKPLPKVPLETP